MLGLPSHTEVKKQLPKSAIYSKFQLTNSQKENIDADISKMTIVNEILPTTVNIVPGENIKGIYVVNVQMKKKDFDDKSILILTRLISQKMVFALEYENELKIAVYHSKLIQSDWQPTESAKLHIKGLDLDAVWEDLIVQIGDIQIQQGNTLDEQIEINENNARIQKEIAKLEKQARKEKQPKKKFELVQRINQLKASENI